jgi:phage terminase large subunit-like protein
VQTAGVAWLDFEKWKRCGLRYTAEDLRGCRVWLGIDMSKNTDLSSIGGIAELSEERWSAAGELLPPGLYALCWNFLPGERIEDVDEREAPYKFWVEQG